MHKVPLHAILLSDIIGIKTYEFHNYSVKGKGIQVNKPHFDVGYVPNDSIGKLIYRPTGVYIFGYSLQEIMRTANEWLNKHIGEIDVEVGRLQATKSKLLKDMESIGTGSQKERAQEPEHEFVVYLTALSSAYAVLIHDEKGDFHSQYTGTSDNDIHALWDGLHIALKNLKPDPGHKILLYNDDPGMRDNFMLCTAYEKRIPLELMTMECFEGLSKLLPMFTLKVAAFDQLSKEYAQCRNALMAWR